MAGDAFSCLLMIADVQRSFFRLSASLYVRSRPGTASSTGASLESLITATNSLLLTHPLRYRVHASRIPSAAAKERFSLGRERERTREKNNGARMFQKDHLQLCVYACCGDKSRLQYVYAAQRDSGCYRAPHARESGTIPDG